MCKNCHRICEIMKCHQSAKKLYSSSIITLNNNKWKVKYLNMPDTHYVIEMLLQSFDCKLCVVTIKCVHMLSCLHMYMLDVTLRATICKHIHLVHMETRDNFVCKDRTLADSNYIHRACDTCQIGCCFKRG